MVGASDFDSAASRKILCRHERDAHGGLVRFAVVERLESGHRQIGRSALGRRGTILCQGIAAGALAVGVAFEAERKRFVDFRGEVDLWPVGAGQKAPRFEDVFSAWRRYG